MHTNVHVATCMCSLAFLRTCLCMRTYKHLCVSFGGAAGAQQGGGSGGAGGGCGRGDCLAQAGAVLVRERGGGDVFCMDRDPGAGVRGRPRRPSAGMRMCTCVYVY